MGFSVTSIPKLSFAHAELSGVGANDHHVPTVDTVSVESLALDRNTASIAAGTTGTVDITTTITNPKFAIVMANDVSGGLDAQSIGVVIDGDEESNTGIQQINTNVQSQLSDNQIFTINEGANGKTATAELQSDRLRLTVSNSGVGLAVNLTVFFFGVSSVVS